MAYNLLTIKKVKTDDIAEPHPDHQKSGPYNKIHHDG